jgi:transcriptional regulator with XRE-family HTH domain
MSNDRVTQAHSLDVAIGHRIRERRRARGMSQQALASAVGVTFQQIQKYERGANRVSFSRLLEIAHALECGLANLAEGLDVDAVPELRGLNDLLAVEGAMDLLEAYRAIHGRGLRRALVIHARTLAETTEREPAG